MVATYTVISIGEDENIGGLRRLVAAMRRGSGERTDHATEPLPFYDHITRARNVKSNKSTSITSARFLLSLSLPHAHYSRLYHRYSSGCVTLPLNIHCTTFSIIGDSALPACRTIQQGMSFSLANPSVCVQRR